MEHGGGCGLRVDFKRPDSLFLLETWLITNHGSIDFVSPEK